MRPYIIKNASIRDLEVCKKEFVDLYHEYGVVIFPGLLKEHPLFASYLDALRYMFRVLLARHGVKVTDTHDLGDLLVRLNAVQPIDGKIITDMGTQPNKLVDFNRLKYSQLVSSVLSAVHPQDAIMATPQAGDTLHFFAPGERYLRYNLPIHQDYPYLMQSPQQITFYLSMSKYHEGVGGLEYWEKSHKLGVLKCEKNKYGAFEVQHGEQLMADYAKASYHWNVGDFAFFDSLLCHKSIPNSTQSHGRVVQIFRFSNIKHPTAERYNWYSTAYNNRRGVDFENEFPELVTA